MGQISFSPEQDINHQLHFHFYGESRWNYDTDLLEVGVMWWGFVHL